ncbi:MAG TPA: gfo/Idh/MocA family oxidoreductase, partial [Terriglobia bacterium]|nr:gfo/Idh/MocA family oxidoreductase [Terriglobia bacterium]
MMRSPMNRRDFLKQSVLTTSMAAWSIRSYASIPGSNSRLRLGVIGCGGMANSHMDGLLTMKESDAVEIA